MAPAHRVGLVAFLLSLATGIAAAQDARELQAERAANPALAGEHPLAALMRTRNSTLLPALRGVHPRVYFTDAELAALRQRARTTHRELWQRALRSVRALVREPAPAPAQERRAQNETGLGIAEAAFAYKIEGDPKYLAAAKRYMEAAVSYDVWGYASNKPNVDLAAGHLLYGLACGYDLLYADLTPEERLRYRDKLTRQARAMADFFAPQPGKTYAYSQNHTFIPIAGLAVAAYALYDEVADAPRWAALARAIFDRVLATYSTDGYYYEGFEYWIFSTPWIVHWLDAQAHATGEDLYDQPGLKQAYLYVLHAQLPGADNIFDFGDAWSGPATRSKKDDEDYARSHPGGHFQSNYNLLYRLAARFQDPKAQGVAQWLASKGQVSAEEAWSLAWYDASLVPVPVQSQPRWHYFPDHEVVYWRSDWSGKATAFALKCGPPEGHHAAPLLVQFPDWRLSAGHAHPDAASFIVHANGAYLTGDSGYAGVPLTAHHNTVLIDGHGQGREGSGHDAWDGVPYERLNQVRIAEVKVDGGAVRIVADATGAYMPELGLTRFERRFEYSKTGGFTVTDTLAAARPATFTALLHADRSIAADGDRRYTVDAGRARLSVTVVEPQDARVELEPNTLTAPGAPGAVDKGAQVTRGQRLAIATGPAPSAQFVVKLSPAWPRASN